MCWVLSYMKESLLKIGKVIAQVPQIASTVNLSGIVCSYIIRNLHQEEISSGRYKIDINKILKNKTKLKFKEADFINTLFK